MANLILNPSQFKRGHLNSPVRVNMILKSITKINNKTNSLFVVNQTRSDN